MPNGLKKMVVNNVRDVDLLLMHNKSFAAEIAHGVSSRNRITILERCFVFTLQGVFSKTSDTCGHFLGRRRWA